MKPCPFCGCKVIKLSCAKKRIWQAWAYGKYVDGFRYYCSDCKGTTDIYRSNEEAREAWERREE